MIKVYNQEFVTAVQNVLNSLKPGYYVTAEQLVKDVGLDGSRKGLIADMFANGEITGFESVKSRGIRRCASNPAKPAQTEAPTVAPQTEPAQTEIATAAE